MIPKLTVKARHRALTFSTMTQLTLSKVTNVYLVLICVQTLLRMKSVVASGIGT